MFRPTKPLLPPALALVALLSAAVTACADPVEPPFVAASFVRHDETTRNADRVTAAVEWNRLTRTIISRREPSPNWSARDFAMVSVAQYNAIIAAERAKSGGQHASIGGASAGAAAAVLGALFPMEQTVIAAQLAADAAYFRTLPNEKQDDFAAGVAIGRSSAAAVLARAAMDKSDLVWTGSIPTGAGIWKPSAAPAKPVNPRWGEITPWLMTSGSQFHPSAPPAFGSPAYQAALAEVRQYTDNRTPAQLTIAQFWNSDYGAGGPAGYFGAYASGLVTSRHFDERKAAQALALLHMAIMDASIGCYEAKYSYLVQRPYQGDPGITTPVGRPNHPSYPSAHSCLSSAGAAVLTSFFPDAAATLDAMVTEAGMARIYAGLHYRFDVDAGRTLGESVAALAITLARQGHAPIPLR